MKIKILSCVVGIVMIITLFNQLLGIALQCCLGAWLWLVGEDFLK